MTHSNEKILTTGGIGTQGAYNQQDQHAVQTTQPVRALFPLSDAPIHLAAADRLLHRCADCREPRLACLSKAGTPRMRSTCLL